MTASPTAGAARGLSEVAFHYNAPDKLAYTCRLARKALARGARLLIVAPAPALETLDAMLWNMQPQDFIAHALHGCSEALWQYSPVVLAPDAFDTVGSPHQDVLVNLGADIAQGFAAFAKVIEIVSANDEQDRQWARARWRAYCAQGYSPIRHDLQAPR